MVVAVLFGVDLVVVHIFFAYISISCTLYILLMSLYYYILLRSILSYGEKLPMEDVDIVLWVINNEALSPPTIVSCIALFFFRA